MLRSEEPSKSRPGYVWCRSAIPSTLRKKVATVDVLSEGRVVLGVGAGWNRQEMRNHGTDPKTRMRLLTERVQAVIEIWTKDEAEYDGQLVNFDLLQAWPKPVQTPVPADHGRRSRPDCRRPRPRVR
jgi:alkanesulfonate monooxygenase SsuD/methylene tetrahydromethanopterin reductase-like flavin-dependent oxidoreductase (luciferase family)